MLATNVERMRSERRQHASLATNAKRTRAERRQHGRLVTNVAVEEFTRS
ncbi:hypothetical protein [Salipaludibacillus keqinensis]|nr:hypothetical protein [Salipaludibacillus keqinensis]